MNANPVSVFLVMEKVSAWHTEKLRREVRYLERQLADPDTVGDVRDRMAAALEEARTELRRRT